LELLRIFSDLVDGMCELGEVHGNLKLENILITENGRYKLSDWGLSQYLPKFQTLTDASILKYAAPESLKNGDKTIASDIYELGVIFYELATLHYPYKIDDDSGYYDYYYAHANLTAQVPTLINPNLSVSVTSIIMRMIDKSLKKRFTTFEEIKSALDRLKSDYDTTEDYKHYVNLALSTSELNHEYRSGKKVRTKKIKAKCYEDVYLPLKKFVDEFNNASSSKDTQMDISAPDVNDFQSFFNIMVTTPSRRQVAIDIKIVQVSEYKSKYPGFFGKVLYNTDNYIPVFKGKNVLCWGRVFDEKDNGFVLLLLQAGDDYEWVILSDVQKEKKTKKPFRKKILELRDQIVYITTMHIYDVDIETFAIQKIFEFVAQRA
jgi:serine/threonine protein kinase